MNEKSQHYSSFKEFYPFYLAEHSHVICRRLHVIGSTFVIIVLVLALITTNWYLLWLLPIIGYGFAWVGHYFFEKNRPATFKNPVYSFAGDWVMYWQVITGKIKF